MGHFLYGVVVDKKKPFCERPYALHDSNLNLGNKNISVATPGNFFAGAHVSRLTIFDLNFDNHVHGDPQFIRRINIKCMQ